MPDMSDRSYRALSVLMDRDPVFVELCTSLYGDVDESVIYEDVFHKRAPDKDGDFQRKVAIGSNALGLTAGAAAIGSTLRDERLTTGGKWARRLHATGKKIPAPLAGRAFTPKVAGRLALGAAALQGANVAGDVVVARTLPKPEKKVSKAGPRHALNPTIGEQAKGAYQAAMGTLPEKYRPTGNKAGRLLAVPFNNKKAAAATVVAGAMVHSSGKRKGLREGFQQGYYSKLYTEHRLETPQETASRKGRIFNRKPKRGYMMRTDEMPNFGYWGDKAPPSSKQVAKSEIPDLELAGTFSKFDDDKRQAFGYASVVKKDGMPVIDRQGDYIDADEMEKAAYHYVQKSRKGGDMHRRTTGPNGEDAPHHVSDLIESMVFTPEKCKAMGLPDEVSKKLEGHWWVGYQIHDEDTWQQVRKQGRTGFSIHGRGKRQETTVDSVMGL